MTKAQQLESLTRMARGRHMVWGSRVLFAAAFAMVATCVYTQHWAWLLGAGVAAAVGWSGRATQPHLQRAAEALQYGERQAGEVRIEVESEAEIDRPSGSNTCHATVMLGASAWRFEFIPVGWRACEGAMPATFYMLPTVSWPALVEVEEGVFYPRYTPTPVSAR